MSLVPMVNSIVPLQGKTFIGIDFGTSTTVVSIASFDEKTKKITVEPIFLDQRLEDGTLFSSEKIATVIAWFQEHILVGEGANNLKYKLQSGKNIWYAFKMELGEDLGAKYFDSELANKDPYSIRNPKDAVRIFFMYLKILIDRYCEHKRYSKDIEYAVTIPASFEANQRRELMEALETNGMNVSKQSLIDEPNAAFLSYLYASIDSEKPLVVATGYNPKVLVFDFGGGTCDISILEIGKEAKGLYSKNLSISKYAKLGGTDIDRYIAYHYLLPRFLAENGFQVTDFRTPERKRIVSQLLQPAERLKIQINKTLLLLTRDFVMPEVKNSDIKTEIEELVEVDTRRGCLTQHKFYLTNKELTEAMSVFLKRTLFATRIKGEDDYNTIFMPIESAIKKANVKVDELDYVLLIGGSAQSPYVQEAIKRYFDESDILIPRDLQTHVSAGAALHSLLLNGMNKCVIQPITSEPIIVLTKDNGQRMLLKAGTQIPSDTVVIDDLVTSRNNQDVVELPICVGNRNKMLYLLKITKDGGFPINTPVCVSLKINADKLLVVQATCMGVTCEVEPQNPFANKELTTQERVVLNAERQANLDAERNGGVPTKNGLIALRDAYSKAGNNFRAAETYELLAELYPETQNYNNIGVMYSNAGEDEKAIEFYKQALQASPNDVYPYFNLGSSLKSSNPEEARQYLKKAYEINPHHNATLIEMGRLAKESGDREEASKNYQEAYENLMKKWRENKMSNSDYSWLIWVARELGHNDVAEEVRRSQPTLKDDVLYDNENLVTTGSRQIGSVEMNLLN